MSATLSTLPRRSDTPTEDEAISDTGPPPPRRGRSVLVWLLGLCSYLPLAALGYWSVWTNWSSQMNGCNCWDQDLLEWFIHWTPSAISQGHPVLVTNFIDAPNGVNVMWNTSVLALGTLAAPLTQTIGVVHTMAIVQTLSLALSASTMFILLRRWTRWLPAAWLGGLLYGFSTFAVVESTAGRIDFVFLAVPPLVVLAIDKLIRREWSPITAGSIIGVLVAFQLFVSEELLAITGLFLGLALVVLAVVYRSDVFTRAMDVMWAAGAAVVTFLVLAAYPLYVAIPRARPAHRPTADPCADGALQLGPGQPGDPGVPQWINFGWSDRISSAFSAASAGEVTEYIGLPLLVFLITASVLLRRRTLVRIFVPVAVVSFWCSMGPRLLIGNDHTGVPGIDAVLVHTPILGDIIPSRFGACLVVLARRVVRRRPGRGLRVAAGGRRRALGQTTPPGRIRTAHAGEHGASPSLERRGLAGLGTLVVGVGVLIPIVPAWPTLEVPAAVPAYFTTHDVQDLPSGSLAVTYPYPLTVSAWPMLWQSDSNMRFRMLGGYAIGPGPDGVGTFYPDSNPMEYCLQYIYSSGSSRWCNPAKITTSLRALHVTSVIADNDEPHVGLARSVIDATLRARPRQIGGVSLWRCVPDRAGRSCHWT